MLGREQRRQNEHPRRVQGVYFYAKLFVLREEIEVLKDIPSAYRVVIKGIVFDDKGRLLLVRERSDTWDLPGGGLEHGEGVAEALQREFIEELKANIEITTETPLLIPTWNTKFDNPVLIIAYRAKLLSEPQTTVDVPAFGFYDFHAAGKLLLDSTLTGIITKFYKGDGPLELN